MSNSAQRVLRVLKALRGHSLDGISNLELSKQLGESPVNITRSLQDLIEEGLATKKDDGRYCLAVMVLQIAVAHFEECERATNRVHELKQRVNSGSKY